MLSTSQLYGETFINSGDSTSFTVGSKSTQPSAGGFLMRSLAVWERSLSSQEVNSVYLAGKKTLNLEMLWLINALYSVVHH